MKLVEADAEGPVEGDDALVTPPRPPHRRVSVSLLFTLTVLIGTVVAIYVTFPARPNVLWTAALERHRDPAAAWDIAGPSPTELRAWSIGVVGKSAPLPVVGVVIVGAREIDVLDRRTALVELDVAGDRVMFLVQHVRSIAPERSERVDGDLRAVAWRRGAFIAVAVGPDASRARWLAVVR